MRNRKPTLKRVGSRYGAQPISWMRRVLQTSARTRALAVAATPHTEIVVTNASTTFHGYSSMRELGASCLAAVQGAAAKSISSGAADATLRSTTTAGAGTSTAGTTVFGWRLRVAGSLTNFNYRPVEVNVGKVLTSGANPGVVTIPTPILSLQLFARRLPLDVFILSVENAGGLATVSPGQAGVFFAGAGPNTTSTTNGIEVVTQGNAALFYTIESLNARDIIARGQTISRRDEYDLMDENDEYDLLDENDEYAQEGLRDEDELDGAVY